MKAFGIYMAAMGKQYPEVMSEMIAYQLLIVNASEQYDGMYWRAYDTHYRVNAAAAGNRHWSRLDIDLYTRFFTGRAKAVSSCSTCDSTSHGSDHCPLRPQRMKMVNAHWGSFRSASASGPEMSALGTIPPETAHTRRPTNSPCLWLLWRQTPSQVM